MRSAGKRSWVSVALLSVGVGMLALQACGSSDDGGAPGAGGSGGNGGSGGSQASGGSAGKGTGGSAGTTSGGSGGTTSGSGGTSSGGTSGSAGDGGTSASGGSGGATAGSGGSGNEAGAAGDGGASGSGAGGDSAGGEGGASGGAGGQSGETGSGGEGGTGDDVSCDPAPVCTDDLSDVGTGDLSISFELTTSATVRSAIISQRLVCSHSMFWDVRMSAAGALSVEFDENGFNYLSLVLPVTVNDGVPHEVRICRIAGHVHAFVDGVRVAHAPNAADFGSLHTLQVETGACVGADGTNALDGTVSNVCVGAL